MKNLLILLIILLTSCESSSDKINKERFKNINSMNIYQQKPKLNISGVGLVFEIEIDNCQYLFVRHSITHKGNCKNH